MNYRDDAYAVDFTLPGDLPAGATAAVLVVDADDLAGQKLDGDPANAVDWKNGGWHGYQDSGPDCSLRLWVGAVGAAPPAPCRGGGHGAWLLPVALLVALRNLLKPRGELARR